MCNIHGIVKTTLTAFCLLASLTSARPQGTLQFMAHLSSTLTPYTADGSFTLTGNNFAYDVVAPYGADRATIQRGLATNAPVISNLHLTRCLAPLGTYHGGCFYRGNFSASTEQIIDLERGEWWATATPAFDILTIRGQIVPIPEPETLGLLGVALGFYWLVYRKH